MAQGYSDEVWKSLKLLWESSGKITWQELVDTVKVTLNCDVPSGSVVRRRAIAEGWKKTVKNTVKSDNKTVKKGRSKRTPKKTTNSTENKEENAVNNGVIVMSDSRQKIDTDAIFTAAKENDIKAADIVLIQRRRFRRLGGLQDECLSSIEHLRDEFAIVNDFTPEEMALPDEKRREIRDYRIKLLQEKMGFTVGLNEMVEVMSKSMERTAKVEAVFWGLGEDDLRDSQSSERIKTITDDSKFNDAQKSLQLQFKEATERAALMNSPDLEELLAAELGVEISEMEEVIIDDD